MSMGGLDQGAGSPCISCQCYLCLVTLNVPDGSTAYAVDALALLARREEDLRLVLEHVVLVPRVAPRYDLGRAHPLADSDLKLGQFYCSNLYKESTIKCFNIVTLFPFPYIVKICAVVDY